MIFFSELDSFGLFALISSFTDQTLLGLLMLCLLVHFVLYHILLINSGISQVIKVSKFSPV